MLSQLVSLTLAGLLAMTGTAYVTLAPGDAAPEAPAVVVTLPPVPAGDDVPGATEDLNATPTAPAVPPAGPEPPETPPVPDNRSAPEPEPPAEPPSPAEPSPAPGERVVAAVEDVLLRADGKLSGAHDEWNWTVADGFESFTVAVVADLDETLADVGDCVEAILKDAEGTTVARGTISGTRLLAGKETQHLINFDFADRHGAVDGDAGDGAAGEWVLGLHGGTTRGTYQVLVNVLYPDA